VAGDGCRDADKRQPLSDGESPPVPLLGDQTADDPADDLQSVRHDI
jgi:hypothetical protein